MDQDDKELMYIQLAFISEKIHAIPLGSLRQDNIKELMELTEDLKKEFLRFLKKE